MKSNVEGRNQYRNDMEEYLSLNTSSFFDRDDNIKELRDRVFKNMVKGVYDNPDNFPEGVKNIEKSIEDKRVSLKFEIDGAKHTLQYECETYNY